MLSHSAENRNVFAKGAVKPGFGWSAKLQDVTMARFRPSWI